MIVMETRRQEGKGRGFLEVFRSCISEHDHFDDHHSEKSKEEREEVSSKFFEVLFQSMIIDDHHSKKTKEEREEVSS